jgi:hypothetical protein
MIIKLVWCAVVPGTTFLNTVVLRIASSSRPTPHPQYWFSGCVRCGEDSLALDTLALLQSTLFSLPFVNVAEPNDLIFFTELNKLGLGLLC